MLRTIVATVALLLAAGCASDGGTPEPGPTSVAAVPDVPRMTGPLPVRLQPALPIAGGSCAPGYGWYCLGEKGYRALGERRTASVSGVTTDPNAEHTAWDTVVRFDRRQPVARASRRAAAMGGVVLIVDGSGRALAAVPPLDLAAGKAQFLGLEKAEAWALVGAFSRSKQGM